MGNALVVEKLDLLRRKELGQFFTPRIIADLMAEWIVRQSAISIILDPAFGLGVFQESIRKYDSSVYLEAYEIDNVILSELPPFITSDTNLIIHNQDYLTSGGKKYDGIICNPPYLKFQKFVTRHQILPTIEKELGENILGYANIAAIFLLKSLRQLKPGGRLAYILPYEFLNAGYGKKIKKILVEENLLRHIIIFRNEKEIFPDVITTVCVILCENSKTQSDILVSNVISIGDLVNIHSFTELASYSIKRSQLDPTAKWSPYLNGQNNTTHENDRFYKIYEYGSFKRGIATGANSFFALSASKIDKLHLPFDMVKLCITKSSLVKSCIFTDEMVHDLIAADSAIYCLDAHEQLDANTQKYIAYGEKLGYNNRYLTRTRKPWYQIEARKPAPILFGVFTRGTYKVIRNLTSCINFSCYHCFYPNLLGINYLNHIFLYLLSDYGKTLINQNQRNYGNGLCKFEPNDLNDCLIPSIADFDRITSDEINVAVDMIRRWPQKGHQIANEVMNIVKQ